MTQTKPGLVVVGLEEMPSNRPHADPNQLQTTQLISQRFSGRKGDYHDGTAPRNSTKRGISGDASIIPCFTSNYVLEKPCRDALTKLEMFSNLKVVEIEAVSGSDRRDFATAFLGQAVRDRFSELDPSCPLQLELQLGDGDTRPLVKLLRMVAFFLCALLGEQQQQNGTSLMSVLQTSESCQINVGPSEIDLKVTASENLVPRVTRMFDQRTATILEKIDSHTSTVRDELSIIFDFWLSRTLAPAVIVSTDRAKTQNIIESLKELEDIHTLGSIDASQYKMMKSLYDPSDTPNLRDDILKLGRGALVAVELDCETLDSQLCIREIIEDTPSLTAFSTDRSALHKSGLLFCVFVKGDITPEIRSRASLIL